MEWCGVFMMGLWASGLRSLRPLASTHSVPRLTTPSFSPHINPFRKNSKLKQNILWFGLSFVQISCRKIRSFPFLVDFHSFLPKRARKYHFILPISLIHVQSWHGRYSTRFEAPNEECIINGTPKTGVGLQRSLNTDPVAKYLQGS